MTDGTLIPLNNESLLLKGCQLRNTEWCYGVAVYTGHQTKVMKNALKSRAKKSKIELQTNTYIIYTVLVQSPRHMTACGLRLLDSTSHIWDTVTL